MAELNGIRVLIVEDEPLLALELEDMLTDMGCAIAGRAGRLETALAMARELDFNVAILDVNLGETRVDAAAEIIADRGIPIVLTTGYGESARSPVASCEIVAKPYEAAKIRAVLEHALGKG